MTVKEFITRFDNHDTFDEYELHDLFWGDLDEEEMDSISLLDEGEGDHCRWNYCAYKVYEINGRNFMFDAFLALTEMQEDYFDTQPREVKSVEKTIVVTKWEEI